MELFPQFDYFKLMLPTNTKLPSMLTFAALQKTCKNQIQYVEDQVLGFQYTQFYVLFK